MARLATAQAAVRDFSICCLSITVSIRSRNNYRPLCPLVDRNHVTFAIDLPPACFPGITPDDAYRPDEPDCLADRPGPACLRFLRRRTGCRRRRRWIPRRSSVPPARTPRWPRLRLQPGARHHHAALRCPGRPAVRAGPGRRRRPAAHLSGRAVSRPAAGALCRPQRGVQLSRPDHGAGQTRPAPDSSDLIVCIPAASMAGPTSA